ncbi:MAG: RNA polymerase sigma factor [Myxococcota bacterium]
MSSKPAPVLQLRAPSESDEELVERALSGDSWAREAIFRRHAPDVFQLVRRLHAGNEVEDLVQQTFLTAFEDLASLRDGAALRSWLLGIAVRRVRRARRKGALLRRFFTNEVEGALEREASPACSPEQRAELALVDRVLAQRSTEEREAWILRRIQGERLLSIASVLNLSLATVKRRIEAVDRTLAEHRHD